MAPPLQDPCRTLAVPCMTPPSSHREAICGDGRHADCRLDGQGLQQDRRQRGWRVGVSRGGSRRAWQQAATAGVNTRIAHGVVCGVTVDDTEHVRATCGWVHHTGGQGSQGSACQKRHEHPPSAAVLQLLSATAAIPPPPPTPGPEPPLTVALLPCRHACLGLGLALGGAVGHGDGGSNSHLGRRAGGISPLPFHCERLAAQAVGRDARGLASNDGDLGLQRGGSSAAQQLLVAGGRHGDARPMGGLQHAASAACTPQPVQPRSPRSPAPCRIRPHSLPAQPRAGNRFP